VRVVAGVLALIAVATGVAATAPPAALDAPAQAAAAASRGASLAIRPEGSEHCPSSGHAAVIDRATQTAWLCADGTALPRFPITTARNQPDPGSYRVYAKDRLTTSTFGGHFSYLDNFVAFTRGKFTGARIAFHALPRTAGGHPYQPYDTVGSPQWHGASSGCIRVLPEQSRVIWDHLGVGDPVIVIS
jgi:hypothetical protein